MAVLSDYDHPSGLLVPRAYWRVERLECTTTIVRAYVRAYVSSAVADTNPSFSERLAISRRILIRARISFSRPMRPSKCIMILLGQWMPSTIVSPPEGTLSARVNVA